MFNWSTYEKIDKIHPQIMKILAIENILFKMSSVAIQHISINHFISIQFRLIKILFFTEKCLFQYTWVKN